MSPTDASSWVPFTGIWYRRERPLLHSSMVGPAPERSGFTLRGKPLNTPRHLSPILALARPTNSRPVRAHAPVGMIALAVGLPRIAMTTIPDLIQGVLRGSAPVQVAHHVVEAIVITMTGLMSIWPGANERLQHQHVNAELLTFLTAPQSHVLMSSIVVRNKKVAANLPSGVADSHHAFERQDLAAGRDLIQVLIPTNRAPFLDQPTKSCLRRSLRESEARMRQIPRRR